MLAYPAHGPDKPVALGAVDFDKCHGYWAAATKQPEIPAAARAACTAKKTRSGVAGLSKVTARPFPNAETASRIASRTEIAIISGGSPTALLPNTTSGSRACSSSSTWNSSGSSDQEGSLYVDAPAVVSLPCASHSSSSIVSHPAPCRK